MFLVTLPTRVAQAAALLTTLFFLKLHRIGRKVAKLGVTERFESKHLPVEMQIRDDQETVSQNITVLVTEKLIWDDNKRSVKNFLRNEQFVEEIN